MGTFRRPLLTVVCITIVSTAQNAEEGRELLSGFGFPFKTPENQK